MNAMSDAALTNDKSLGLPLIPVSEIYLDHEFNCRGHFSATECIELAKDIALRGLQQPVIVRPLRTETAYGIESEDSILKKGFKYKMIAGHRRLFSYKINKADQIPAIVKDVNISEFECKNINAVENLQRKELNLFQEAVAVRHYWIAGWTLQDTANYIGKSNTWVNIRFKLLEMPEDVQIAAAQGYIVQADILELSKYKDPTELLRTAGMIRDKRKKGETKQIARMIRRPDKADTKKHRGRDQIFDMLGLIQDTLVKIERSQTVDVDELITPQGNCLATRALSWAAGEISSFEMHKSLQEYCATFNHYYEMPEFSSHESVS